MDKKRFSIKARINSFGFALKGLESFFLTQHNAWLHLAAAIVTVCLGYFFQISPADWCWIVVAIVMVFVTEMFNTAIEFLSDVVSANFHPQIKKVKDVSAAAVLLASVGAVIIGLIVFLPYILSLLQD